MIERVKTGGGFGLATFWVPLGHDRRKTDRPHRGYHTHLEAGPAPVLFPLRL